MNIYFRKEVSKVFFFGDSVTFRLSDPVYRMNKGLSFIANCISEGNNDIDTIAQELLDEYKINSDLNSVKEMILSRTLEDDSLRSVFTSSIDDAQTTPIVYGTMGKRYPKVLHIELTGTCNFQCSHCYKNATYNGKYIDKYWLTDKIQNEFKGLIPIIHFTGGEPTLHPEFKDIVALFEHDHVLQLTTNGSTILSHHIDLFKKFEAIDVSLYGLSPNDYLINTGNYDAFDRVKQGCISLSKANIEFRVTLIVNNDNWHQMEDYVRFAIELGAKRIGFGLPTNGGKLLLNTTDKWSLSAETRRKIYKNFRAIQSKYGNIIDITEWDRKVYSDLWKTQSDDDSLRCGGGTRDWWLSEKYTFRPCSFLPEQYICLDYTKWYNFVTNKEGINWAKARRNLELFATENNRHITDFCSIFRREN